jgi:hypothetical protein
MANLDRRNQESDELIKEIYQICIFFLSIAIIALNVIILSKKANGLIIMDIFRDLEQTSKQLPLFFTFITQT